MATRRFAHRTLSLMALLAVVLGIGLAAHAQDGGGPSGRQAVVQYRLRMSTAEERVCLDQTVGLPLTIEAVEVLAGDVDAGRIQVLGVIIQATSPDASIVEVDVTEPALNITADEPVIGGLRLTGLSVGRTTISVDVIVENSHRFGFATPVRLQASLPVRVVPCEYRVDLGSIWVTRLHNADYLIAANIRNIPVTGTGGNILSNDPRFVDNPPLRWNMTVNRIRGCEVGNPRLTQDAPRVRAEILDDAVAVTISYPRFDPPQLQYYAEACRVDHPLQHSAPCYEHPDGVCFVWSEGPRDWFAPNPLEGVKLIFPLDGGTVTVPHHLIHAAGGADGGTVIVVTPVRRQQ